MERIESLVVQVLEETRAFRQEMRDELAPLKSDVAVLKSDVGLMKLAILQNSRDIRELRDEVAELQSETRTNHDRFDG